MVCEGIHNYKFLLHKPVKNIINQVVVFVVISFFQCVCVMCQ